MKKYFDILGLKEDCERELIKAAYKTLIHKYHPDKWEKNKGYPTKEHREALLKYGSTVHHRKSFKLL